MHLAACACPAVGSKEVGGVISGYWGLAAGCLNSRRKEAAGRPSLLRKRGNRRPVHPRQRALGGPVLRKSKFHTLA
jgi:hypothetical protein